MTEQSATEQNPQDDQTITVLGINKGNVSVGVATIVLSKASRIVIHLEDDEHGTPVKGQSFTLLYDRGGEHILRLKTKITDVIQGGKCFLEPTGPVSEGERREFLRAQVTGRSYLERVEDDYELIEEHGSVDSSRWYEQEMDLSGSGVKLEWDGSCKKGDRLRVSMVFEGNQLPVTAVGEVVRARPGKGEKRLLDVAVHFVELSESGRDRLNNVVFKYFYQQVGSRFGTTLVQDA